MTPQAGVLAEFVPKGYHNGIAVDLTKQMQQFKPQASPYTYYFIEYLYSMELLRPHIAKMAGGEYFFMMMKGPVHPALWNAPHQNWPPLHGKSGKPMTEFGSKFVCDHFRTSGCPIEMIVMRAYDEYPHDQHVFKICMSTGHHRLACNHLRTKNRDMNAPFPSLHPHIDMWLRQKVQGSVSNSNPLKPNKVMEEMKVELRAVTALHCDYPEAGPGFVFRTNHETKKKICCHAINYQNVVTMTGYHNSANMPVRVVGPPHTYAGRVKPYPRTEPRWCNVYHMFLEDGHSNNGNHRIEQHTQTQIKSRLRFWNRLLRDPNLLAQHHNNNKKESGVGPVHKAFEESNLFARWNQHISTDPKKYKNLKPFEWVMIGLLYVKRDPKDINKAAKRKHPVSNDATSWEEGDFPQAVDPKNLPYEFVAVYASLYSLVTSVKAWMTRKESGKVQVCADNMYNCCVGVPNMYWLNVGVIDAKSIHHPTVIALQLGRAKPRNEVTLPS
jgi:hypothetical protein